MPWEMAVIPSLLNNSDTWICLEDDSLKQLEELQSMLLRSILNTAKSTPKALLYWDTGVLHMAYRVEEKKLLFLHHLISLPEDCLAKQFYVQQKSNNFPGLVQECQLIINKYSLMDITESQELPTKITWKKMVQSKVNNFFEAELKSEIKEKYSKLKIMTQKMKNLEPKATCKNLTFLKQESSSSYEVECLKLGITLKGSTGI